MQRGVRLPLLLTLVALITASVVLAGCNTVEGVGKDVQSAGKGIEKGAKDVKEDID